MVAPSKLTAAYCIALIFAKNVAAEHSSGTKEVHWEFDTGATSHILNDASCFDSLSPTDRSGIGAVGDPFHLDGIGAVTITIPESNTTITLPRVFYKADLNGALMSVSKMAAMGFYGTFGTNVMFVYNKEGKRVMEVPVEGFKVLTTINCSHTHELPVRRPVTKPDASVAKHGIFELLNLILILLLDPWRIQ